MARFLKTLLIVVAVVLVPLRTMAAVMVDLASPVHQQTEIAQAAVKAEPDGSARCEVRVPHCAGGAITDAAREPQVAESATSPVPLAERSAPAFIPERLDRPPLALLR